MRRVRIVWMVLLVVMVLPANVMGQSIEPILELEHEGHVILGCFASKSEQFSQILEFSTYLLNLRHFIVIGPSFSKTQSLIVLGTSPTPLH